MVHSIKNTTVQKHAENIEWLYPIFQDIENKETEKNAEMERFYIFFWFKMDTFAENYLW